MDLASFQTRDTCDFIRVNDLNLSIVLNNGACWPAGDPSGTLQPISLSLLIPHEVTQTAVTDDLSFSIDYGKLSKAIRKALDSLAFESLEALSLKVFDVIAKRVEDGPPINALRLEVVQLRAPLHTKCVGIRSSATFHNGNYEVLFVEHFLDGLVTPVIVGVKAVERVEKQDVRLRLSLDSGSTGLSRDNWLDFRGLSRKLLESFAETSFETLESLTSLGALTTLAFLRTSNSIYQAKPTLNLAVAKPSALVFAESSEVEIRRTFEDYPEILAAPVTSTLTDSTHTVAIALGSNLGDMFHNIELALRLLDISQQLLESFGLADNESTFVSVVDTSFMYETAPMYFTDQPSFINCACMIETNLQPLTILLLLKRIEDIVGRVPSIRNGPRAVDLDLIFYDNMTLDTRPVSAQGTLDNLEGELVIPHPRLPEREFVLRPLNDIIPDFIHPVLRKKISTLLAEVPIAEKNEPKMQKVIVFPQYPIPRDYKAVYPGIIVPPTLQHWKYPTDLSVPLRSRIGRKTHIMATLNVTPDSFSDGAMHNTIETALEYTKKSVMDGATMVDIGGYSTRPGAEFVSVEEEIRRVVPMVQAIRKAGSTTNNELDADVQMRKTLISVDTFRSEVAEACIKAGANCINDVYAFTGPEYPIEGDVEIRANEYMSELKRISRAHYVPVVLMHSRGDAGKNKDYSAYNYAGKRHSVVEGVHVELGEKVDRIVKGKGSVRRWMVIVDPGIGFSKTLEGNLELLREAATVTADISIGEGLNKRRNPLAGYPQLIGVSRKSFLGAILSSGEGGRATTPTERIFATASAVTCVIQQGAVIVRIHDVKEIGDTVRVADAIWN